MPQALPAPQEYALKLKSQFQDKSIIALEEIRQFALTQLNDVIDWDINIYFDELKALLNERVD
jgi:hypothetical protein